MHASYNPDAGWPYEVSINGDTHVLSTEEIRHWKCAAVCRAYRVDCYGYEPNITWAPTRGRAMAQAVRAYCDAFGRSWAEALHAIRIQRAPDYDGQGCRHRRGALVAEQYVRREETAS